MKKKLIFIAAVMLTILAAQIGWAEEIDPWLFALPERVEDNREKGEYEGFEYAIDHDQMWREYVVITNYPRDEIDLVFPSTINNLPVRIGWQVIANDKVVETIKMPEIAEIGTDTFCWCPQLQSITFAYGTEKIKGRAAVNCPNLRYVVIPSSVKSIAEDAFDWKKVTLEVEPGSYAEIFAIENGIRYAYKQEKVNNGDASLWYDDPITLGLCKDENGYAFGGGYFKEKKVMFPASYLGEAIVEIYPNAYYDCWNESVIVIPGSIKTIGGWAFFRNTSLARVYILDGVKSIGRRCFDGCNSMEFMVIPPSVTEIEEDALSGTIYAEPGSYAADYAIRNGYYYQPIQYAPDYRLEFNPTSLTQKEDAKTSLSNVDYESRWGWQGDVAFFKGKNGKYGLLDRAGNMVIEPIYDSIITPFSQKNYDRPAAAVMLDGNKVMIAKDGSTPNYQPQEQPAVGYDYDDSGDGESKRIIKAPGSTLDGTRWDAVYLCDNTCFLYQGKKSYDDYSNGLWRITDKAGNVIKENIKYDRLKYLRNNRFLVGIGESKYLIDENGEVLCEVNWEVNYTEFYSEGLLAVKDRGRYCYVDENGNVKFQLAEDCYLIGDAIFHDGLAPCFKGKVTYDSYGIIRSKQGAYGYIDTNGNIVIDCQFEDAKVFSNGLAAVQLQKRYGFIDSTGNIVIQPQWVYASSFDRGGFTMVSNVEPGTVTWETNLPKRQDGLINKKGEMVLEMKYDMCYEDIMSYCEEYSAYVVIEDDYDRLIYLNNETGEIILDRIRE